LETADRSEFDLLPSHQAERSEQLAVDVLRVISASLGAGSSLESFYRSLTAKVADLVGASRVLFWQLGSDHMLRAIPGAHGVDDDFIKRLYPAPCYPEGTDLTSQVVYRDLIFRAALGDPNQSPRYRRVLDVLQVSNAMSAPWRAGDVRLGVVAAYDSINGAEFTSEDAWMLEITGIAAGLVWQLKQADAQLSETVERLQQVDSARQLLLRNLSTAVDRASKRFATDLHDDALQKLTAAEIQLQRVHDSNGDNTEPLAEAQILLAQTEEALRRLLFEVRPPALEVPGGFIETIRERIRMLKSLTGVEVQVELDVPDDLSYEFRSMLFRQITETMTNIEKHSSATQVRVSLREEDGGMHGVVEDNGRGFVVAERDRLPGHLGLLALNERALLAGGWNKIRSEPGLGTTVEFWLPLSESRV